MTSKPRPSNSYPTIQALAWSNYLRHLTRLLRQPFGLEAEQVEVERFLRLMGVDVLAVRKSERPDFIVEAASSFKDLTRIGIEVTRLYSDETNDGSKERTDLAMWRKVTSIIAKKQEGSDWQSVWGNLCLKPEVYSLETSSTKIADELCIVGKQHVDRVTSLLPGESLDVISFDRLLCPSLHRFAEKVSLKNSFAEAPIEWWWSALQSGPVLSSVQTLVEAIERKTGKSMTFDWQGADQRWLLVVSPGERMTDHLILEDTDLNGLQQATLSESAFTAIFHWWRWQDSVMLIYPKNRPSRALRTRGACPDSKQRTATRDY